DDFPMISQEGHPLLARVSTVDLRQVSGDRRQAEIDSQFRQLRLNLSLAPPVLQGHPGDQGLRLFRNRRPTRSRLGDPSPVAAERSAVPTDHGLRPNENENTSPMGPEAGECDPEGTVQWRESR